MFRALLVTRMLALREFFFGRVRKRAGRSKAGLILFSLLVVYLVAAVLFSVGVMFELIAKPLINAGLGWLVMGVAALMSAAMSFIGSIFMAEKQLFEARDNDLLLSMPVPPSVILASRVILIYVSNLIFGLFILLPAFVVYGIFVPKLTAGMVAIFILETILLAFFSTALTSACGWIIAAISSRLRRKNLVSTLLAIVLLFGYMYFSLNLQNLAARLIMNGAAFSEAISKALPPIYLFGAAIDGAKVPSLLAFALWCMVPFAAVYYLLSKSFIGIATTKRGELRVKYREKELKTSSVRMALIKKELGRFFSLPMYILNCSLGAIMAVVLAGALIVKRNVVLSAFAGMPETGAAKIALIMCAALCFMAVMDDITAPSISLEGKTMWFLKSAPVDVSDIFLAKVAASLIVTAPLLLLSSIIVGAQLRVSPLAAVFLILAPLAAQVFISLFGLALNLKLPRFDWISEIAVIKQSASVMISVFGGMGAVAVPVLVYVFFAGGVPAEIYMALSTLYFSLLALAAFIYLKKKGRALFGGF